MNSLGRCEEVFHLLIVDAYKEIDLSRRKEALKKIVPIVNTAVSAGHKELQFYVKVRRMKWMNDLVDNPRRNEIDRL